MMHRQIKTMLHNHEYAISTIDAADIEKIATEMLEVFQRGGIVFWIGNGGSASDCEHIAAEFVGSFKGSDVMLPCVALTSVPAITSIANDFSYDVIFSRQINALVTSEDAVIGLSTSGKSENVRLGLEVASMVGATTFALLGNDGGEIAAVAEHTLIVPVHDTARVQECHITIGHIICELIHNELSNISHKSKRI